jgi:hypothetical protein
MTKKSTAPWGGIFYGQLAFPEPSNTKLSFVPLGSLCY